MRFVIALGGNAMTAPDGTARPDDQRAAIEPAMAPVAAIVAAGHQVVLDVEARAGSPSRATASRSSRRSSTSTTRSLAGLAPS